MINSDTEVSDTLDPTNAGRYDQFVQACLSTGAYCMIDVHNFARFNGGIIGQGGPSDDMFVAIWAALAKKYAKDERVVFEITNEPHDLDVNLWVQTCQKVVTGIRNAGATTQMILLPGSNFDSAATITSAAGGADALLEITNPDGSFDGLYLDIHKYLDNNNSGQYEECTTNNVGNFSIVADYLRQKKRQALISETGASSSSSCMKDFCTQNAYINENDDVFIGYVAWAAGQFDTSYVLSLTPTLQPDGSYTDNELFSQCVLAPYQKAGGALLTVKTSSASPSSTTTAKATKTRTQTSSSSSKAAETSSSSSSSISSSTSGISSSVSHAASLSSSTSAPAPSSTNAAASQAIQVAKNVIVAVVAGAALL